MFIQNKWVTTKHTQAQWRKYAFLNWVINIGLGDGLSTIQHQAIAWTNANLSVHCNLIKNKVLKQSTQGLRLFFHDDALENV